MIENTLKEIEARLAQTGALTPESRTQLLQLLATLKSEITALSESDADRARSIAGFTQVSTHEATRDEKNPKLLELSIKGLASSVEGFDKSHPQLVQIVNSICNTLSNLGI
jgi:queuine/archaeosine tRNA-ribosyltransferase